METIPRNVILDLLPAYIAGEVSEESRALVEKFAHNDPQIAKIISTGTLEPEIIIPEVKVPDELELKMIKRVRRSIQRQMIYVALGTASILLTPLIAMQFTDEVNWNLVDFLVMGVLLLGTGLTFVLISRSSDSIQYRIAVGVAVTAGLLLVWMNLAVGIIGSEDNPANLMYIGVLAIAIIGSLTARFSALGMARTMFATAIAQILVPVIALIFWMPAINEPPGILGVFILNLFFTVLFIGSSLLFRSVAKSNKGKDKS